MFLGKVLTYDPDIKGWRAPLPHFFGVGQHGALLFQLVNGGRPDVCSVDVATLPGGNNRRRLQVNDLHLARLNAPVFQRGQQAVMRSRDKRHRDAFADQIFGSGDGFLHHQRFGISELRGEQEDFDRHLLAGGYGQRAGAKVANLHVARGKRPHNRRAAVELTPVDFRPALFGEGVIRLRDFRRFRRSLICHGDVHRLRLKCPQRQCAEKCDSR